MDPRLLKLPTDERLELVGERGLNLDRVSMLMRDVFDVERIPSLLFVLISSLILPSVDCIHYTVMTSGLTSGARDLMARIAAHL